MRKQVSGRDIVLGGRSYVLVPKSEYEILQRQIEGRLQVPSPFDVGSIGADLRSRRLKASLTLKQVALGAGIRLETLSRIETGRTNPSARTVQAVLRALEQATA
jgi:DNA-binding XRE family transcriptional regulator